MNENLKKEIRKRYREGWMISELKVHYGMMGNEITDILREK